MRSLLLILSLAGLAFGATRSTPPAQDDTPLQESMGQLNSSLRTFRKAMKADAPDKEAALTQILSMQDAMQVAKLQVPDSAKALDAAKGRAFTKAFRKDLILLQRALLDLEVQVLDEDFAGASAAVRGLLEHKKAGHDKYIEDA